MLTIGGARRVHFIGICGTGMATLAAMFQEKGMQISGSDRESYPPMSEFLASKGIPVLRGFSIEHLQPEPELVIVGNAISRGNPEVEFVLNFKLPYLSFPEALKSFFLREKTSIVVTGTHGKTTTTSMIAWVLHLAGLQPNFFIGGMAQNFDTSYALGEGQHFVIEGDEYDTAFFDKGPKFLHYRPDMAIVANLEYDHADIYPDVESILQQFERFVNLLPERGYLAVGAESPLALQACRKRFCEQETFGMAQQADWAAGQPQWKDGRLCFDILYHRKLFRRVRLPLLGSFNIRNTLAATAILNQLHIPEDTICGALEEFKGVRRRLQLRCEVDGIQVYEDFAHHPTAVRATIQSIQQDLKPRRLWAVYEPRSATSRRNIFQDDIAEALGLADSVIVSNPYKPEAIPEADRLDVATLVRALQSAGCAAWNIGSAPDIIERLCEETSQGDVIVILSNGAFDGIPEKLPEALRAKRNAR